MIIDTLGQFQKLLPSYSRCIDLTKEQMLEEVEGQLAGERKLANPEAKQHWAYDLNLHMALGDLRDALVAELAAERRAA